MVFSSFSKVSAPPTPPRAKISWILPSCLTDGEGRDPSNATWQICGSWGLDWAVTSLLSLWSKARLREALNERTQVSRSSLFLLVKGWEIRDGGKTRRFKQSLVYIAAWMSCPPHFPRGSSWWGGGADTQGGRSEASARTSHLGQPKP